MFRVLEVILLGGGSIGAFSGWMLTRWLDGRQAKHARRRFWDAAHARPAVSYRPSPQPGGLPPLVSNPHERCNHTSGGHVCSLAPGHAGEHECACSRIPQPHRFA